MGRVGLFLQPMGMIRGVVLDTANGSGVARVSVRRQATGRLVLTDEDGRFEIADVPPGAQELYVSAVDFILVKRAVTVTAGAAADVTIVLSENVANHENVRFALPPINRRTFEATRLYESMIPLIPSLGILLEF